MRPKPTHLKLLSGTARPDRETPGTAGVSATDVIPAPPGWMRDVAALAEWQRIAKILAACHLLTEGTASILPHVCMLHSRFVTCWTDGTTPSGTLLSVHRKLCGDLGLTNMATPAPAGKVNRFLLNGKRR